MSCAIQVLDEHAKPGKRGNPWRHRLIVDVLSAFKSCFGEHANVKDKSVHDIFYRILDAAKFPTKDIDIQPLLNAAAAEVNT